MQVYIYLLELENNKYYVGKTSSLQARVLQHFSDHGGSEWTRAHKPVRVIETHETNDIFAEEKYTLLAMDKYGIDNVRGGSMVQHHISKSDKERIMAQIRSILDRCFNCGMEGHFAKDCVFSQKQQQVFTKSRTAHTQSESHNGVSGSVSRDILKVKLRKTSLHGKELYEPVDIAKLKALIDSNVLIEPKGFKTKIAGKAYAHEKTMLQQYMRSIETKKGAKVLYKRPRGYDTYGRVNPFKGLGLHMFRKNIRHFLARDILVDIGIVDAAPTIFSQVGEALYVNCENLRRYVNERANLIDEVKAKYDVSHNVAEDLFIRLLFTGTFEAWAKDHGVVEGAPLPIIIGIAGEINCLAAAIIKNNHDLVAECKKKAEYRKMNKALKESSVVTYYMQTVENEILETVFNYMQDNGIITDTCSLCNDGIMIPIESYTEDLCDELSAVVEQKFGLKIRFIRKEMGEGFALEDLGITQLPHVSSSTFEDSSTKFDFYKWVDYDTKEIATMFHATEESRRFVYSNEQWFYCDPEYNTWEIINKTTPLELIGAIYDFVKERVSYDYNNYVSELESDDKQELARAKKVLVNTTKMMSRRTTFSTCVTWFAEMKSDDGFVTTIDSLDGIVPFIDRCYDFKTKQYRDYTIDDRVMQTTGYMSPDTDCEDGDEISYIHGIVADMLSSKEEVDYVMKIMAYSLVSNGRQKLYVFTGRGGNGKSVLINLLASALGKLWSQAPASFLTGSGKGGPDGDLSYWKGKRGIGVVEPGKGKLDTEFLKSLTGDDKICVRSLYGAKAIEYVPKFTIFMACNDIPSDNTVGDALMRRLEILSFKKKYVENPKLPHERKVDLELNSKFRDEKYYTAFMHHLISIAQRLFDKEDSIVPPASVLEAAEEYAEENNDVKMFINDNYVLGCDKKYHISTKDLYDEYKRYCGCQEVIKRPKFMTEMRAICDHGQRMINGVRVSGFFGIRRRSEVEAEFQEAAEEETGALSGTASSILLV